MRDLDAMSTMNAEEYEEHGNELWSEAREEGKLTIASASDEAHEKIAPMRIPRARGDKMPPFTLVNQRGVTSVLKYRAMDKPSERGYVLFDDDDTNSPVFKAQVKRMIKWLSRE